MENCLNVTIGSLVTAAFWVAGLWMYALVWIGVVPDHMNGMGNVLFTVGSLLYLTRLLRSSRHEAAAAYELGRVSVEGGKVRPIN